MPNIEVRGKYRTFRYDGNAPLDFTPYNNSIFLIRRPNPTTFVTLQQYVPGQGGAFTTFDPGSSYTMVTNADGSQDFNFNMGPYTRVDRLPSSTLIKTPNFYIGLDKNSIAVPISSYALSVNTPLSSVVNILYQNGQGNRLQYVAADSFKTGAPVNFTHFLPNSGYELRNRVPFTFFAPLKSEMGDAFAWGNNNGGEFGMGYRYNNKSLPGDNIYGTWDKIVSNNSTQGYVVRWNDQTFAVGSFAALSACGNSKALFVLGNNYYGQLGTGSSQQYYPTWTRVPGQWKDVAMGALHMLATNDSGHLYACGSNQYGQLGLGYYGGSHNILTLVDSGRNYVQLAAKEENTMVLDSFGFLYGCGRNRYGELGRGNTTAGNSLIRETTYSIWSSVKATIRSLGGFVAISDKKLYGTSSNNYRYLYGALPDATFTAKFKQEQLGLTDVESVVYSHQGGTYIKRENQDMLFASRYPYSTLFRLSAGDDTYFSKTIIPSNVSSLTYNFYILNNRLYYCASASTSPVFIDTNVNAFNMFEQYTQAGTGNNGGTTLFLLSSANHFRPTPTPTPTPSPLPFPPVNVLQVAIFGGSDREGGSITQQNFAYNSPGNLSNNFILDRPNAGYIPPGVILSSTFDYEKGNFNNIVGIGVNVVQSPNKRYIYKKIGSKWTYTLLPSDMDASTTFESYSYDHGCDTLLITPEHPNRSSSQGVYNLIFVRNRYFNEAVSYDRGLTWTIMGQVFTGPNYYGTTYVSANKVLYSRSRGVDYKVRAVMVSSNNSQIFFAERFPYFFGHQLIYTSTNIYGFNFIHDYNDIPTVVSSSSYSDDIGSLALTRRINGSWQTSIVKQNIPNFEDSPKYYDISDMGRINSPTIGLEVDPTNYNLIYIAYLRNAGFGSYNQAVYINVLCYNMATNSVVFDESVVRATRAQGSISPSIHTVDSYFADVPNLFYDKTNNSLNLFFVGWSNVATPEVLNFRMTRINGNWSAPTSFVGLGTTDIELSNNNELRVKY